MNRNSFSWLFAAAALAACTPRANFVDNVDGSSDAVADGSAPDGVVSDTATDRVAVDGATNDGGVDVPVGPDAKVLDVPTVDDVPVGPDAKVLDVPPSTTCPSRPTCP